MSFFESFSSDFSAASSAGSAWRHARTRALEDETMLTMR
jgi:hypothetical protein